MKNSSDCSFRKARSADIPFLVDTIIEAEKSGTDILTYTTIFGLSEIKTRECITSMLEEEVEGCELSVSSFLLAELDSEIVGSVAAWIEGSDGIPSTILKANLLNYTLPKDSLERASKLSPVVRDLHIENKPGTLQIGLVYVKQAARGRNLASAMIDRTILEHQDNHPGLSQVYIQVFENNMAAIRAYIKAGFFVCYSKTASLSYTTDYMPHHCKVLMRKDINLKE